MKRSMIIVFILSSALVICFQRYAFSDPSGKCDLNHNLGFTCPILAEKDSDAVFINLINHPASSGQDGNFLPQTYIEGVRDFIASPGKKIDSFNPEMLMNLPPRGELNPVHGIGPSDAVIVGSDGIEVKAMIDYQSVGNEAGRRLTIGDIRKVLSGNEFQTTFGSNPLEDGYIGASSDKFPYDNGRYPSAIMSSDNDSQYCFPSGGMPFFRKCEGDLAPIGEPYEDIFIYDVAKIGDMFVGTSYDPFILDVNSEAGFGDGSSTTWKQNTGDLPATYISPLVFFGLDENGQRYKLQGVTSWQMPGIKESGFSSVYADEFDEVIPGIAYEYANSTMAGNDNETITENMRSVLGFDLTNPYLPVLTNPIAADEIGGMIAVLYQTIFLDLDNYILNPYGRPYTFPDVKAEPTYYNWDDLLGTRASDTSPFVPLKDTHSDYFPNGNAAPVAFWVGAGGTRAEVDKEEAYEDLNPSHMVSPDILGLVSPGSVSSLYGQVAFTDYSGSKTDENSWLAVASNKDAKGVIYLIDPDDPGRQLWMKSFVLDASGWPTYEQADKGKPKSIKTSLTNMPVVVPREKIDVDPPSSDVIPYKVYSAALTEDACPDLLVTWRGKGLEKIDGTDNVRFDDDTGRMFADKFTVISRTELQVGIRKECVAEVLPAVGMPSPNGVHKSSQVAALAAADFSGDGRPDIVAPNMQIEMTFESTDADKKYTGYAYIFEQLMGADGKPSFSKMDTKRLRVGYREFSSPDEGIGPSNVVAGGKTIFVTNGYPLMLPEVGCQDYLMYSKLAVSSVYGFMQSAAYAKVASTVGLDPPFAIEFEGKYTPIPTNCLAEMETCATASVKTETNVPLWKSDCGEKPDCMWSEAHEECWEVYKVYDKTKSECDEAKGQYRNDKCVQMEKTECKTVEAHPENCTYNCYVYNALCYEDAYGKAYPRPFVGYVNCGILKLNCDIEKGGGLPKCEDYLTGKYYYNSQTGQEPAQVSDACCKEFIANKADFDAKYQNIPEGCAQYYYKTFAHAGYDYPDNMCEYYFKEPPSANIDGEAHTDIPLDCCGYNLKMHSDAEQMPYSCCINYRDQEKAGNLNGQIPDACCGLYNTMAFNNFESDMYVPAKCCDKYNTPYWSIETSDEGITSSKFPGNCCDFIGDKPKNGADKCKDNSNPTSWLRPTHEKDDAGDSASGTGTEFAQQRPDAVYSSDGHGIAMADETIPVADEYGVSGYRALPTSLADYLLTDAAFMLKLRVAAQPKDDILSQQTPPSCQFNPSIDTGNVLDSDISFGFTIPKIAGPLKPDYSKIRLPRGAVMPGERELTAIIPYISPEFCPNGQIDIDKGEECDGTLIAPGHEGCICTPGCRCEYPPTETCPNGQLDLDKGEECDGDLIAPGKEGCICNPGCKCDFPPAEVPCGNNALDAGEDCDVVNGNTQHQPDLDGCLCSDGCKCTYPPQELIEEIKPEEPLPEKPPIAEPPINAEMPAAAPTPIISDCFVSCDDFSTNEYKEVFEKLNEENCRGPTGRTDDCFCEMGQKVKVVCYVRNAFKATTVGGETKWEANPYMITQDSGLRFDPLETQSKVQLVYVISSSERIIPLLAGPATDQTIASAASAYTMPALPDLSMAGDVQIIKGGIEPMAAESVIHGADGSTTIINNMIKHTMDRILPENFQFKGQQVAAGDSGQSDAIHTTEVILPYFAIFGITLDSGQQQIKNLEDQGLSYEDLLIENQPTPEDVRVFLETEMAKGKAVNSGITYEAPWAKQSHYKFSLITEQGGKGDAKAAFMSDEYAAGSAAASSLAISQFSVFATDPTVARGGSYASAIGSCVKCTMYDDDIDLKVLLVLMAFVLVTSGGVAAVRVFVHIRRRKR